MLENVSSSSQKILRIKSISCFIFLVRINDLGRDNSKELLNDNNKQCKHTESENKTFKQKVPEHLKLNIDNDIYNEGPEQHDRLLCLCNDGISIVN